jgi:hypothetical protein
MMAMPPEKLAVYQEVYDSFSNVEAQSPMIRDFIIRVADERVNILSTQNLSWMGFFKAPFSHDFENADIAMFGAGIDDATLSEAAT